MKGMLVTSLFYFYCNISPQVLTFPSLPFLPSYLPSYLSYLSSPLLSSPLLSPPLPSPPPPPPSPSPLLSSPLLNPTIIQSINLFQDFNVVDTSQKQVLIAVDHEEDIACLYASDVTGQFYIVSVENIVGLRYPGRFDVDLVKVGLCFCSIKKKENCRLGKGYRNNPLPLTDKFLFVSLCEKIVTYL